MRRFVATAVTAVVAGGLVGAIGTTTAGAQTPDNQGFCDAVLNVQAAIGVEQPDETEVTAALTDLTTTAPPEVAPAVTALINALAAGGDPSQNPEVSQSLDAVGQYAFDSCGWQTAEVSMAEYEFDGLPRSFTTGPAAIKITNDGAEVHELMTVRIKSKDKLKALVKLPEKKAEKKVQVVDHTLVGPGDTAYTFIDFARAGRYGAVCFIPTGTLSLDDLGGGEHGHGGGKPHTLEGMYKEFKVTKASA